MEKSILVTVEFSLEASKNFGRRMIIYIRLSPDYDLDLKTKETQKNWFWRNNDIILRKRICRSIILIVFIGIARLFFRVLNHEQTQLGRVLWYFFSPRWDENKFFSAEVLKKKQTMESENTRFNGNGPSPGRWTMPGMCHHYN